MKKIALLISGRITRYDVCLLPLLQNTQNYEIHVFASINNEHADCEYFSIMKQKLNTWLKGCIIQPYKIPDDIFDIFNSNESIGRLGCQANLQKVNNKFVPYNCLSMYYNDNLAFKTACEYADKNNFEYDYYMKFRSDIANFIIPDNLPISETDLQCVVPNCAFISNGLYNMPIVCDMIAWGNRKVMSIYCNTYQYVLNNIRKYDGKYFVAGECSLTDCICENNLPYVFYKIHYNLDANRRMFDTLEYHYIVDQRIAPIKLDNQTADNVTDISNYSYKEIPVSIYE